MDQHINDIVKCFPHDPRAATKHLLVRNERK